jgi:hypothetical protein
MGLPADKDKWLLQVHVKKTIADRLKVAAEKEGLSRSDLVRRLLYRWDEETRAKKAG